MSDVAMQVDGVSKKFRKGEIHDSLRDLIPALTAKLLRPGVALEPKEFWALRDVTFHVPRGEAFGIIGHNGAGKSTMLKLLSRIMKPTIGQITVQGRLSALIEVGAGFHPDLTGRENIYLNGTILGMSRAELRANFDPIVDFSGLAEFIDTPVKRYSSGMYARLGFSVAAHVNPEILIVDEVLSVGDYVFQSKCVRRMKEVIQSGATVIFVSHNLRAVAEICSRSMLLEHGHVKAIGPTPSVVAEYLERIQGARVVPAEAPAYLSEVRIRGSQGDTVHFNSGDKAWVDVTAVAREDCHNFTVALDIQDDQFQILYDTSAQQLGEPELSLKAGQVLTITFELTINMARGTFHVGTYLHRFHIQKAIDTWCPSGTIVVSNQQAVSGCVNCFARVVRQAIHNASSTSPETA